MAEYIEREAIFSKIVNTPFEVDLTGTEDCYRYGVMDGLVKKQDHILDMIAEEPAADVVEVVRCKDCKFYIEHYFDSYCGYHTENACDGGHCDGACYVEENDFCSYGERKKKENE